MKSMETTYTWETTYDELCATVKEILGKKPLMQFSIFKDRDKGFSRADHVWEIMAPDIRSNQPVFTGKVRFMIDYWRVTDEPILSKTVTNPTWKKIIRIFDEMIQQGDGQGVFLEEFELMDSPKTRKVQTVRFVIGS